MTQPSIFDCDDDTPTPEVLDPLPYEGMSHQKTHEPPKDEDQNIELDATASAYCRLPPLLQRFVDRYVARDNIYEIVKELGLATSYAGVLMRRQDVQDAIRERLQVEYGPRIMGELEMMALLSGIARTSESETTSIKAMAELANIQGLKDRAVRDAKERIQNAEHVVITREEGAGGTLTKAQVAAMEDEE